MDLMGKMMADEAQNAPLKRKLPIKLIVIDVIGTALLVVGYIEQNHLAKIVPHSLKFPMYAETMTLAGVALSIPLLYHFFRAKRAVK
jgi:hypothetical protein